MEPWHILAVLLSSLTVGSCYVILTLGYTVNARVQRFFDVSQGAAITTGVYGAWFVSTLGFSLYFALLSAAAVGAVTAMAFCRLRLSLAGSTPSPLANFLAALGYLIAIEGIVGLIAGGEIRVFSRQDFNPTSIGTVTVNSIDLTTVVVAILVFTALSLAIARTQSGRLLRAVASSPTLARVSGLPVRKVQLVASAIGGALSGVGGAVYAWQRTAYPTIGLTLIIAPLAISILGTRFSWVMLGAIAVAYGGLESLAFLFVPGEWKETFVFLILILMITYSSAGARGIGGLRKA